MKASPRALVRVLIGMTSAAMSFALIVIIANELIVWRFAYNHPHDPSAGDSAGWAFVFLAPIIFPLGAIISTALGVFAYFLTRARFPEAGQPEQ